MVAWILAATLCLDPVAVMKSGALEAGYKVIAELLDKNVLLDEDLKALAIGLTSRAAGIRRGCAEVVKKHVATELATPLANVYVRETEPSCKKAMAGALVSLLAAAKQEQPIEVKQAEAAALLLAVPDKSVASAASDLMDSYRTQEKITEVALTWWLKNRTSYYVEGSDDRAFVASPAAIREARKLGTGVVIQILKGKEVGGSGFLFEENHGAKERLIVRGFSFMKLDGDDVTFTSRMVRVGTYKYRSVGGEEKIVREYVPVEDFTKDQKLTFEVFVKLYGAGKLSKYFEE